MHKDTDRINNFHQFSNPAFETINKLAKERTPFLFLINFNKDDIRVFPLPVDTNQVFFDFPNMSNSHKNADNSVINLTVEENNFETYLSQFQMIQNEIKKGNITQINLTQATSIIPNQPLQEIYKASSAKYKLYLPNHFVVFSPETFIQIQNNVLISKPMKGTIDASIKNAQSLLLNSKKEQDEHHKVIEMVKEELGTVSADVWVERYRYISEIRSNNRELFQVSSDVHATLDENWHEHLGEILDKLLPASSICGIPKAQAIDVIHKTENYNRGFYTGVMGVFDGHSVDSAVMIRFIEKIENQYFYKSGGGITALSSAKDEYQELLNKIYVPIH